MVSDKRHLHACCAFWFVPTRFRDSTQSRAVCRGVAQSLPSSETSKRALAIGSELSPRVLCAAEIRTPSALHSVREDNSLRSSGGGARRARGAARGAVDLQRTTLNLEPTLCQRNLHNQSAIRINPPVLPSFLPNEARKQIRTPGRLRSAAPPCQVARSVVEASRRRAEAPATPTATLTRGCALTSRA